MNKAQLKKDIQEAINRNSAENGSDTPDFILADYLMACLDTFDFASVSRARWHDNNPAIGKFCNGNKVNINLDYI